MSQTKPLKNKEKFIRVYANLPLGIREEIVCVLNNEKPVTWNAAFLEIENNTKIAEEILRKLLDLKII